MTLSASPSLTARLSTNAFAAASGVGIRLLCDAPRERAPERSRKHECDAARERDSGERCAFSFSPSPCQRRPPPPRPPPPPPPRHRRRPTDAKRRRRPTDVRLRAAARRSLHLLHRSLARVAATDFGSGAAIADAAERVVAARRRRCRGRSFWDWPRPASPVHVLRGCRDRGSWPAGCRFPRLASLSAARSVLTPRFCSDCCARWRSASLPRYWSRLTCCERFCRFCRVCVAAAVRRVPAVVDVVIPLRVVARCRG